MPDEEKPDVKKIVCPDCAKEVEAGESYCSKCDYPLYAHRLDDDLERVRKRKAPAEKKEEKKPVKTSPLSFFGGR